MGMGYTFKRPNPNTLGIIMAHTISPLSPILIDTAISTIACNNAELHNVLLTQKDTFLLFSPTCASSHEAFLNFQLSLLEFALAYASGKVDRKNAFDRTSRATSMIGRGEEIMRGSKNMTRLACSYSSLTGSNVSASSSQSKTRSGATANSTSASFAGNYGSDRSRQNSQTMGISFTYGQGISQTDGNGYKITDEKGSASAGGGTQGTYFHPQISEIDGLPAYETEFKNWVIDFGTSVYDGISIIFSNLGDILSNVGKAFLGGSPDPAPYAAITSEFNRIGDKLGDIVGIFTDMFNAVNTITPLDDFDGECYIQQPIYQEIDGNLVIVGYQTVAKNIPTWSHSRDQTINIGVSFQVFGVGISFGITIRKGRAHSQDYRTFSKVSSDEKVAVQQSVIQSLSSAERESHACTDIFSYTIKDVRRNNSGNSESNDERNSWESAISESSSEAQSDISRASHAQAKSQQETNRSHDKTYLQTGLTKVRAEGEKHYMNWSNIFSSLKSMYDSILQQKDMLHQEENASIKPVVGQRKHDPCSPYVQRSSSFRLVSKCKNYW
jgi:hypothetical protein